MDEKLARAHAFIEAVAQIVTDSPESSATKIAELFAVHGEALAQDGVQFE